MLPTILITKRYSDFKQQEKNSTENFDYHQWGTFWTEKLYNVLRFTEKSRTH